MNADHLLNWFHSIQNDVPVGDVRPDDVGYLTTVQSFQPIWQYMRDHFYSKEHVKQVRENLELSRLKEKHHNSWKEILNSENKRRQLEIQIGMKHDDNVKKQKEIKILDDDLAKTDHQCEKEIMNIKSLENHLFIFKQFLDKMTKLREFSTKLISLKNDKQDIVVVTTTLMNKKNGPIEPNEILTEELTNIIDLLHQYYTDQVETVKYQQHEKLQFVSTKFLERSYDLTLNILFQCACTIVQKRIQDVMKLNSIDSGNSASVVTHNEYQTLTYNQTLNKINLAYVKKFLLLEREKAHCHETEEQVNAMKLEIVNLRNETERSQTTNIIDTMLATKSSEVYVDALKKKLFTLQTEDKNEPSMKDIRDEIKQVRTRIDEKKQNIKQLDSILTTIFNDNLIEELDRLQSKLLSYEHLLNNFAPKLYPINELYKRLCSDILATVFKWQTDQFYSIVIDEDQMDNSKDDMLQSTPGEQSKDLKSLKELLGIVTVDRTPAQSPNSEMKARERWNYDDELLIGSLQLEKMVINSSQLNFDETNWSKLMKIDEEINSNVEHCQNYVNQFQKQFQSYLEQVEILYHEHSEQPAFAAPFTMDLEPHGNT
ncbi:unnamed protein product [Didymodactylos carnosus]|uniref:Uncharacterized protein n=1 Tax=Didymodactylos carnosus TaxID=1234261 RepID=A0A813RXT9_9BILA|nr:unnamed protein product [Didymodactylos carnosus]CAF0787111.1 unnamed protein product [Didymodactylos carnosus]CAF3495679.1 unnamed protein product [Didymodactylos carnosus]CAF3571068.1 unnamed protein product [Didymodactylos carnosus]